MERVVVADRLVARVLAVLPAIAVALAVRLLTLGHPPLLLRGARPPPVPAGLRGGLPPLLLRVAAAASVALACWVAYRLLTARVVVTDHGVEVRGVLYDADIRWAELDGAEAGPAARPLQALVWGIMQPHGLVLRGRGRTLRPIAAVSHADDEDVLRAIAAIRARLGAWSVPTQRQPQETVT